MSVDQEKAFDKVDTGFLYKIMSLSILLKSYTKTLFLLSLIMASILIHLHYLEE